MNFILKPTFIPTGQDIKEVAFDTFPEFWGSKLSYYSRMNATHFLNSIGHEFLIVNKKTVNNITDIIINEKEQKEHFHNYNDLLLYPQSLNDQLDINEICLFFKITNSFEKYYNKLKKDEDKKREEIEKQKILEEENKQKIIIKSKQELKHEAKKQVNKKFVIGNKYFLRIKSKNGSEQIEKTYICKKFIYTMKETVLNAAIMKQVSGPQEMIFTLNKDDCKRLHIKYEQGLQVLSMNLNWIEKK